MAKDYDVVIIGAGPGGYVAAIKAAQLGLKTAIIEKEYWGGVCLNIGCIPSKALLHNAELAHTMSHRAEEFGFSFENFKADYGVAYKRSRQTSAQLVKGIKFLMKKNKIDTFEGKATFASTTSLTVALNAGGEEVVNAKNIIIATGARPRPIPGLETDGKKVISYIEAILSDTNPKKAVIVGAGAIGMEFGYIWKNYGTDLTIVEMQERVLPREEKEIGKLLGKAYKAMGVDLQLGTSVESITGKQKLTVTLKNGTVIKSVDQVLVAVSFVPNVESIGLDVAGVQLTERGYVGIDDQMRTNVPNIYAIGDVTGKLMLAHVASAMALVAADTIAGNPTHPIEYINMPRATYCEPQVASFGLTEAEAKEQGYEVNIGNFPFQANGKSLGMGQKDGFIKIISDKKYGEILGAHMVGHGVTELLPELTLAQQHELTAEEIAHNVHAHPTLSEALMEAAHGVEGKPIHI